MSKILTFRFLALSSSGIRAGGRPPLGARGLRGPVMLHFRVARLEKGCARRTTVQGTFGGRIVFETEGFGSAFSTQSRRRPENRQQESRV